MYLSQFITEKEKLHTAPEQGLICNRCECKSMKIFLQSVKSVIMDKRTVIVINNVDNVIE